MDIFLISNTNFELFNTGNVSSGSDTANVRIMSKYDPIAKTISSIGSGGLQEGIAPNYARTADRALLDAGERQKYATIRLCRGAVFDMSTTYPAEVVEANRRDLGMEITFALAQPYMDGLCRRDSEGPAK